MPKNTGFITENTQKRHLKRRNTPSYRVIHTYSKSTKQSQRERKRRSQVLKLSQEGKGTREIALALGVTSRTILRDMAKLHRYLIGQINKKYYLLDQQRKQDLETALSKVPLEERFKRLTSLMCWTRKLSKKEEYEQHNFNILINMDDLTNGFPSIIPSNKNTTMTLPYHINFIGVKNGEKHVLASWLASKSENRGF